MLAESSDNNLEVSLLVVPSSLRRPCNPPVASMNASPALMEDGLRLVMEKKKVEKLQRKGVADGEDYGEKTGAIGGLRETERDRERMEFIEGNEAKDPASNENLFIWNDETQLYFHASSGFYHDPNAGWYYSSRDGRYYQFENGKYVLLESDNVEEGEMPSSEQRNEDKVIQEDGPYTYTCSITEECRNCAGDSAAAQLDSSISHAAETPAPPSEWLEDTLIDLFLSGYNQSVHDVADGDISLDIDSREKSLWTTDTYEMEEGEWIPGDCQTLTTSTEEVLHEASDEEKWLAQYGQVVHTAEEAMPEIQAVDLWDWQMVTESKNRKGQVSRLIGRLVKQSTKFHPSMPSRGSLLKTAPICEVHLDLVQVSTGKVYRLHSPSSKYLASLPTYDSSDPTKDWGFPELSGDARTSSESHFSETFRSKQIGRMDVTNPSPLQVPIAMSVKSLQNGHRYRDRAAERRALHNSFGLGPGQKVLEDDYTDTTFSEGAAVGALNTSFGPGSYARRVLEGMGWKEGECLGSSQKGLFEPLQPIGNIGNAGLGWPRTRDQSTIRHCN